MTPLPSHRSRARPSARAWHGSRRRGRTLAGLCCVVALLCLQAGPAHAFDGAGVLLVDAEAGVVRTIEVPGRRPAATPWPWLALGVAVGWAVATLLS